MNFASINLFDVANGNGIRVSLFVSGCNFGCKGCFNVDCQKFEYGSPFTETEHNLIIDRLKDDNFQGLSLLGGDPLWQDEEGLKQLIALAKETHKLKKDVWMWSGFTFEEVMKIPKTPIEELRLKLLKECDVFIDGRFELNKKSLGLIWKGSSNQRVIDIKKSLRENRVIEVDEYYDD